MANKSISKFIEIYESFKQTDLWRELETTVEDSPWHREGSVAIHTEMVVQEYLDRTSDKWDDRYYLGALACMFHDVGKPIAEEHKNSDERGNYRSYAGHELSSAREFENFALERKDDLQLSGIDIFAIGWMIQHHLPYKIHKPNKLQGLVDTLYTYNILDVFCDVLLADQYGRIADMFEENQQHVESWIVDLRKITPKDRITDLLNNQTPTLRLLVGPSSAGKSTYTKKLTQIKPYHVYSWDQLRLDWYTTDDETFENVEKRYSAAFERACADKEFDRKCQATFMDLVRSGIDIIVDNTNLSAKRRRFFTQEAMKRGYGVIIDVCMITRTELIKRATTRPDRNIPVGVIINMHNNMTYPSLDECHEIMVVET